jgi:hypothetical protein
MKLNPIEEHLADHPGNVDETLESLRVLLQSLTEDPGSWENASLDQYLDALIRWLEAMKDRVGDKPSWELFSIMLEAAKIYE